MKYSPTGNNLSSGGSDPNVSIPQHLVDFPITAKKIQICYKTITKLLDILDDTKYISESVYIQTEKNMKTQMNILNDCLVDIFWNDIEVDKFNAMERYYKEVSMDCMEYLLSKIDETYYDINARIQKNFDALSDNIISIERTPSLELLNTFYIQMKEIKEILESEKYENQMSILQYQTWGKKYNAALNYVKELRSHT